MPVITVRIAKGRPVEQKRALTEMMTRGTAQVLGVKEEWITVLIEEYTPDNWATGGKLHCDLGLSHPVAPPGK